MHHDASIIAPKISGDAGDTAVASVSIAARRRRGVGVASKAETMVARTQLATLMLNHHDT